jgi:hypothetical protein
VKEASMLYVGERTREGCRVWCQEEGREAELPLRLDLWNHSPTGFEWSYGGSGPAQLALALLAHALGDDERAVRLHQAFKGKVVAGLPREGWTLLVEEVRSVADELEREEGLSSP